MANYNRYLEDEDAILLEMTKSFDPYEYKEKSRALTAMLKAVVIRLPHRNIGGLRKRYLRLHGIVKSKEDRDRIKRDGKLSPGPKASYVPLAAAMIARTDPIDDNECFIKPPSRDQLMSRRG